MTDRTQRLVLRCTADELEQLREAARMLGYDGTAGRPGVSSWVRDMALDAATRVEEGEDR